MIDGTVSLYKISVKDEDTDKKLSQKIMHSKRLKSAHLCFGGFVALVCIQNVFTYL